MLLDAMYRFTHPEDDAGPRPSLMVVVKQGGRRQHLLPMLTIGTDPSPIFADAGVTACGIERERTTHEIPFACRQFCRTCMDHGGDALAALVSAWHRRPD